MEQIEKTNVQSLYKNAVDYIVKESYKESKENYEYIYNKVYSEHNGLSAFAMQLQNYVEQKLNKNVDLNAVFNANFFTTQEKQLIVTYWVVSAILNETESIKSKNRAIKIDFHNLANKYNSTINKIMSNKIFVDDKGVKYKGSDIFGNIEDTSGLKQISTLNEFAITTFLITTAVFITLGVASPAIAKTMPGVCEVVRNCAEKYPVATKIFDWGLSPFDLEAFIEQDKINKGESTEEDGDDIEIQDGDEDNEADEVIMADGSIVNVEGENINPEELIKNSNKQPKKEIRTFINANGQKQSYEFIDYDV